MEKLFIIDIQSYPELLKIELKINDKFITITNYIYSHLTYNPTIEQENIELYVSNLFNIIEQDEQSFILNKSIIYNELKTDFVKLTDSFFDMLIQSIEFKDNDFYQNTLLEFLESKFNKINKIRYSYVKI